MNKIVKPKKFYRHNEVKIKCPELGTEKILGSCWMDCPRTLLCQKHQAILQRIYYHGEVLKSDFWYEQWWQAYKVILEMEAKQKEQFEWEEGIRAHEALLW